MKKLLLGVVVLAVLAVGGYFGASFWAQARAEKEVEAAFGDMRASGMTATHGAVSFDLLKRTLVVADVALETKTVPVMKTRIGRVTAAGISPPSEGRVSVDRLALADVEVGADIAGLVPDTRLSY